MRAPVYNRFELHAVVGDFGLLIFFFGISFINFFWLRRLCGNKFAKFVAISNTKRESLESTRVSHGRSLPVHKFVKSTRFFNYFFTRLKIEVIGVCQNYLSASLSHLFWGK